MNRAAHEKDRRRASIQRCCAACSGPRTGSMPPRTSRGRSADLQRRAACRRRILPGASKPPSAFAASVSSFTPNRARESAAAGHRSLGHRRGLPDGVEQPRHLHPCVPRHRRGKSDGVSAAIARHASRFAERAALFRHRALPQLKNCLNHAFSLKKQSADHYHVDANR